MASVILNLRVKPTPAGEPYSFTLRPRDLSEGDWNALEAFARLNSAEGVEVLTQHGPMEFFVIRQWFGDEPAITLVTDSVAF